jgi:hypothetical protein
VLVQWSHHDVVGALQVLTSSHDRDPVPGAETFTGFVYRRGRTLWRGQRQIPIAHLRFEVAGSCAYLTRILSASRWIATLATCAMVWSLAWLGCRAWL